MREYLLAAKIVLLAVALAVAGWAFFRWRQSKNPELILVTGYCNCGKCCGWEGSPEKAVYNYGKLKGKPKKIGVTASGTIAHKGTVAADPSVFPFGTRLEIPGYGTGTVEDIGGAIKGRHIDIWFTTHEEARRWGAQWLKLGVYRK